MTIVAAFFVPLCLHWKGRHALCRLILQCFAQMRQTVNLNAELREWLTMRLSEVLGDDPENINYLVLNIHEAKDDIFRLVYDYQVRRNWPHVAERTADALGIDRKTVYRKS